MPQTNNTKYATFTKELSNCVLAVLKSRGICVILKTWTVRLYVLVPSVCNDTITVKRLISILAHILMNDLVCKHLRSVPHAQYETACSSLNIALDFTKTPATCNN